jgi:hypothetical protein
MTAPQRLAPEPAAPAAGRHEDPAIPEAGRGPTAAQLRRFIKSRAYVPLHELRRRFELNGDFDDVSPIEGPDGTHVYVGLPPREAGFISELACAGDIGLELSQDPLVPIVVGVYAMRPVARS